MDRAYIFLASRLERQNGAPRSLACEHGRRSVNVRVRRLSRKNYDIDGEI